MKFLLAAVNAKYIHSNPAIYSLRAYAGLELQPYVELAEYTINQPMTEILADIHGRRPDVIGFSCYIWNWRLIQELLAELPKVLPGIRIWLGGPEVSYDGDAVLERYPQLEGIMAGEGEATFRELLSHYAGESGAAEPPGEGSVERARKTLQEIPGLCLPSGYTSCRALLDLDSIPFPYDDLKPFENRILYYETSRGCPFRCSYCLSSIEKQVRLRDIRMVEKELQFFLDHRVKQVKLVDRTFNCSHEHAMAVWRYLLEHDNGVTNFHFEISADILTEDEIELLGRFRPGLAQLEIGVQSTNPAALEAVGRRTDIERLERTVAAIRRRGNVHLHLDLIAGLPYEDYESFGESFDRVYRMRPEQLQLGFLKVLKGSGIWERAGEYGIRYLEQPPYEVLYTEWLSYEDMLRLKRIEEMVELYHNSGQFTHTMPFLEMTFPGPFALYEALADFYGEKGYPAAGQTRAYRCQALLSFADRYDRERLRVYRELLTYDIYLRENAKSRPEFAGDISVHREAIRDFYSREEQERRYLPGYEGYDRRQLGRMTHLEPFTYPVWDLGRMADRYGNPAREDATYFVLFDYRKRNPLNHEAWVQVVPVGDDHAAAGSGDGIDGKERGN